MDLEINNREFKNRMALLNNADSVEFIIGFETGSIWEQMRQGFSFLNYVVYTDSVPQLREISKLFMYDLDFEEIDELYTSMSGVRALNVN